MDFKQGHWVHANGPREICDMRWYKTAHKQYLFGLIYFTNAMKTLQTKDCNFFYSALTETNQKPSKVGPARNPVLSLYVTGTTCFDECFLLHVITGKQYFLCKFEVTLRFFSTVMLLRSLKHVLRKIFWSCVTSKITPRCWYKSSNIKLSWI